MAEQWKQRNPEGRVIERDLRAETPCLRERRRGSRRRTLRRTSARRSTTRHWPQSDAYIDELMAADLIVIGVPMHNFSISAPLKAWIDQIVRAGKTFSYGEKGPKGLLPDRTSRCW